MGFAQNLNSVLLRKYKSLRREVKNEKVVIVEAILDVDLIRCVVEPVSKATQHTNFAATEQEIQNSLAYRENKDISQRIVNLRLNNNFLSFWIYCDHEVHIIIINVIKSNLAEVMLSNIEV